MAVDVVTSVDIARPRPDVAAYACDPDNATRWYANIRSVQWRTPRPLAVGTRVDFVAVFLGRRLAYTYEVRELSPGSRLVMSTEEGPFPMETSYSFEDTGSGGTRMTLHNRGVPSGFAKVATPALVRAMSRANSRDLARLKKILESAIGSGRQPGHELHGAEAVLSSGPVPVDRLDSGPTDHGAQYDRHQDEVVGVAGDRDEVGHQVERQQEVHEKSRETEPEADGQRRVSREPPHKADDIGKQPQRLLQTRAGGPSPDEPETCDERGPEQEQAAHHADRDT